MSTNQLADWIELERKCCPFFGFEIRWASENASGLNDKCAGHDEAKVQPSAERDVFPKDKATKKHARHCKYSNVNAQDLGEVPVFGVHHKAVPCQAEGS
jgi:hypothetical protein